MKKQRILLTLLTLLSLQLYTHAADVIANEGAWCWFADPRALHYSNENKTIDVTLLGYIDVRGQIKATQIDWLTNKRTEVLVRGAFETDDHDNPTFLVLPDERIMIFYSYHSQSTMFYRVSKRPGDISCLGPEKKMSFNYKTTYPSPFILSDDPDHIWICWRGGENWHPTIARTTLPDDNGDVEIVYGPKQIVQSTGARPYAKYQSNGKDKLYLTYTTGHPDNEMPNWVYFNVVDINGGDPILKDINGETLKRIADGPFNVNKTEAYKTDYPQTLVDTPTDMRDWVWQITSDKEGHPVVLFVRLDDARTTHTYYYTRWTGTEWRETEIGYAGHAFHKNWSSRERCYSSGMAVDPDNAGDVYVSLPTKDGEIDVNGVYELWKYVIDDNGEIVSKTQLTTDSKKNNVRPFVLPCSAGTPLRLAWMNGDYYFWASTSTYPRAFPTAIWTDCKLPVQTVDLNNGVGASPDDEHFSISMQVTMPKTKADYQGTFFNTHRMKLDVTDGYNLDLKFDNTVYRSPSRLLYTDKLIRGAATAPGETGSFALLPKVTMTVTYDGRLLTLYRNELVDMQIEVEGLSLGDVKAGTYDGSKLLTWSRVLNADEIRTLTSTDFDTITSGIIETDSYKSDDSTPFMYDLTGRRLSVNDAKHGVYIVNGKKIIIK